MMLAKRMRLTLVLLLIMLSSVSALAQEAPLAWYDAERQALAINPYAEGYGGSIYFDFDFDHVWGGVIDQSGWDYVYGNVTDPGLFFSKLDCEADGSCETEIIYGWGERLGSLSKTKQYKTYVINLPDGTEAVNKFYYFTDTWDVTAGETTIFVQPMDSSNNVLPVLPDDVANVSLHINGPTGFEWRLLSDLYPPSSDRVVVKVRITPKRLNLESKGRWITAWIKLPKGRVCDDTCRSSINLSVQTDSKDEYGVLLKSVLKFSRPKEIRHKNVLIVKFSRKELRKHLVPGTVSLQVTGKFKDGDFFEGTDTIRVYSRANHRHRHRFGKFTDHDDDDEEEEEEEEDSMRDHD